MHSSSHLCMTLIALWTCSSVSFVVPPTRLPFSKTHTSMNKLYYSIDDSKSNDEEDAKKRKMKLVRSLQHTFYKSDDNPKPTFLGPDIIRNLPLWRVGWTELPGRSNILNVFEPIYTHMFETILYGKKPWYVGHLYLPGGSKNIQLEEERYRLKGWEEEATANKEREGGADGSSSTDRSAVVGTLLRIVDYRRMSDGRLLLLVQSLERFVVRNTTREQPYSIADVQILPDWEEMRLDTDASETKEIDVCKKRSEAVADAFHWHEYEYDAQSRLPLPKKEDLPVDRISAMDLARMIPHVPFSISVDPAEVKKKTLNTSQGVNDDDITFISSPDETTLESRLTSSQILREPPSHPEIYRRSHLSTDELEQQLWICIDEFLRIINKKVLLDFLTLLPPNKTWPDNFYLETTASSLIESTEHCFVRVTEEYPVQRRQKLLSFAAAALLEGTEIGDMRQMLLEIPSTHARLRAVLERFELILLQEMGEFL